MPHDPARPLSPFLIYKPQISSVLSILHRITGFALAVGSLLLVGWLWAAAYSFECFESMNAFFKTCWGLALLAGWSFAFYYHLGNGIRHLFWDAGMGYGLTAMTRSGWLVVLFSLAATGGMWWCLYTRGLIAL